MAGSIPPPHVPFVDSAGHITPEWYRYLGGQERNVQAGEVATTGGLSGGGLVANGLELSVADNGVSNAKLRDSLALSVIGRPVNSTGDPSDIQAVANFRVLSREGDQLAFRRLRAESFTVAGVPSAVASGAGAIIYVSNEAGGAVLAFSDATNWLRVTDRAIVS